VDILQRESVQTMRSEDTDAPLNQQEKLVNNQINKI
jgi:hypothetical protein